MSLHEEG
jgi:hypothetical protein